MNSSLMIFDLLSSYFQMNKNSPVIGGVWTYPSGQAIEPLHILPHLAPRSARLPADIQTCMPGGLFVLHIIRIFHCAAIFDKSEKFSCIELSKPTTITVSGSESP